MKWQGRIMATTLEIIPAMDMVSAVDLYCGIGGLTHGLVRAGISVVAGIDVDVSCKYAYEVNNGAVFINKGVEELTASDIARLYPVDHVKILVGCAPCQPFSRYTIKPSPGEKWKLLSHFADFVRVIRPEVVSMENVPDLSKHEIFTEFLAVLHEKNYHTSYGLVNCVEYGVPQTRTRLVLFASRLGEISIVPPTHTSENQLNVFDTIGSLEPLRAGQASTTDPLHRASALNELNLKRIAASKPGRSWRDWPDELKLNCHKKRSGESFGSVYGRMMWDAPAPTMTTQCNGIGNGRFGHPEQDRAISLREAALFQTFPREYDFIDPELGFNFTGLARHIGNAVPVRLGEIIAQSIRLHLEKHRDCSAPI